MDAVGNMLDEMYLTYFQNHEDLEERWLLMQNLALTGIRRQILDRIPFRAGDKVMDLGCGFGLLALDLAATLPVQVVGVDVSPRKIAAAVEIAQSIHGNVQTLPGTVSFQIDNGYGLSSDDGTYDWVISQHMFQHLEQPEVVLEEVSRVLRPGGRVCIIDVDDGLSISYPEEDSFHRLSELLMQVQEHRGGDRQIGRKLPFLLHAAGFDVLATMPVVQAQFLSAEQKSFMFQALAQHFNGIREDAIQLGLIAEPEFDNLLCQFLQHPLQHSFEVDVQFVITAQKSFSNEDQTGKVGFA